MPFWRMKIKNWVVKFQLINRWWFEWLISSHKCCLKLCLQMQQTPIKPLKITKYILFHLKSCLLFTHETHILSYNVPMNRVSSCKFLGVFMWMNTWIGWTTFTMLNQNSLILIFGLIFRYYACLTLYCNLGFPYISYCNIACVSNYPSHLVSLL